MTLCVVLRIFLYMKQTTERGLEMTDKQTTTWICILLAGTLYLMAAFLTLSAKIEQQSLVIEINNLEDTVALKTKMLKQLQCECLGGCAGPLSVEVK